MNINTLETKIRTNIKIVTKEVCINSRINRSTKISNLSKYLLREKRKMIKGSVEYNDLNETIKTETRDNLRHYNKEMLKIIIKNNKNVKVPKTVNIKRQTKPRSRKKVTE